MKGLILLGSVAFLTDCTVMNAQTSAIPNSVRAVNTIERLTDSNGLGNNEMLYGIPLAPGGVVGDNYLTTDWSSSAILLYKNEKLIKGYPIRYDIAANQLNVKSSGGIKVLEGSAVKSFSMIDSARNNLKYFINAGEYTLDGSTMTGFFEVLVDGRVALFKRLRVVLKKADYNSALDIGSRDDKIVKQATYYLNQTLVVTELPSAKNKLASLMGDRGDEVKDFIDRNKLSVRKEDDLVRIFQYYNSLLTIE